MKFTSSKGTKQSSLQTDVEFGSSDFPLLAGFKIIVRALSNARENEILKRATRNGQLNSDKLVDLYAQELFIGWENLSPAALDVLLPEWHYDQPKPFAGADGFIEFDVDLAALLLRDARPEVIQNPVLRAARSLHTQAALEKKAPSAPTSEN